MLVPDDYEVLLVQHDVLPAVHTGINIHRHQQISSEKRSATDVHSLLQCRHLETRESQESDMHIKFEEKTPAYH